MDNKFQYANHCVLLMLASFVCLTWNQRASADVEQYPVRSLEWLVDMSDAIVIATVQQRGDGESLRVDQWLKPASGNGEITAPTEIGELECLSCIPSSDFKPFRKRNDRLLLFARVDGDQKSRVHHLIYLRAAAVKPPKSGSYKDACRGIYLRATLALHGSVSSPDAERVCAVLNMHGEILVDPDFVIESVKQRVTAGPTVPADAEVDKLERFFSPDSSNAFGGFYAGGLPLDDYVPWADSWGGSEFHLILVPPEPEFLSAAFAALTSNYENVVYARPALQRLANYPHDPRVVEWLQEYLRDGKPEKVETRTVDGKKQSELLRAEVRKTIDTLLVRKVSRPNTSLDGPQRRSDSP